MKKMLILVIILLIGIVNVKAQQNENQNYNLNYSKPSPTPYMTTDKELKEVMELFGMKSGGTKGKYDLIPPVIVHKPVESYIPGKPLIIKAKVTDNNPNVKVNFYFRYYGSSDKYMSIPMKRIDNTDYFEVILPTSLTKGSKIEYYIEAIDIFRNRSYTITNINRPHIIVPNTESKGLNIALILLISFFVAFMTIIIRRQILLKREKEKITRVRKVPVATRKSQKTFTEHPTKRKSIQTARKNESKCRKKVIESRRVEKVTSETKPKGVNQILESIDEKFLNDLDEGKKEEGFDIEEEAKKLLEEEDILKNLPFLKKENKKDKKDLSLDDNIFKDLL